MCVILHGLRKKHVRRAEVEEAMKNNGSGFFLASLGPGGRDDRKTLRTLDKGEALRFFDALDENLPFVMHARIPSRGDTKLENVHGWEEDGILFCHNMTLSSLDGMMRRAKWDGTDSEFFFRKLFMPFYRGCGPDAYRDGKFCEDLDNFVEHFVGTSNKFLFVMPDNGVLRYGSWVNEADRREGGEIAFWASNTTYRVYRPAWPPAKDRTTRYVGYDYDPAFSSRDGRHSGFGYDGYGAGAAKDAPSRYTGETVTDMIGVNGALKLALTDVVFRNLVETRRLDSDDADAMDHAETELMPEAFTDSTFDVASEGLADIGRHPGEARDIITLMAELYAQELELAINKSQNHGVAPMFLSAARTAAGLEETDASIELFKRLMNLSLDFDKRNPAKFAVAYALATSHTGAPMMRKVRATDLLGVPEVEDDVMERAFGLVLERIREIERDGEETAYSGTDGSGPETAEEPAEEPETASADPEAAEAAAAEAYDPELEVAAS